VIKSIVGGIALRKQPAHITAPAIWDCQRNYILSKVPRLWGTKGDFALYFRLRNDVRLKQNLDRVDKLNEHKLWFEKRFLGLRSS
jgi:hypothetical protein